MVSQTMEIPQLLDKVVDVHVVQVLQVLTCRLRMKKSLSHSSCSLRESLRSPRSSTSLSWRRCGFPCGLADH